MNVVMGVYMETTHLGIRTDREVKMAAGRILKLGLNKPP